MLTRQWHFLLFSYIYILLRIITLLGHISICYLSIPRFQLVIFHYTDLAILIDFHTNMNKSELFDAFVHGEVLAGLLCDISYSSFCYGRGFVTRT